MSVILLIVLIVLGVLLLLAIIGGASASLRNRAGAAAFTESLTAVDRQLAAAIASDHGWERHTLDAVARGAFSEQRPDAGIAELELVQVVDEPGTDRDLAVFRILAEDGAESSLTLGRRDGAWFAASLEDLRP